MKSLKENLKVYVVTDRSWLKDGETLVSQVEKALQGGATMIQLREKTLDEEAFLKEAREMKKLCRTYGVPLILNDRVDLVQASGADGVHVGLEDLSVEAARKALGPEKIIGASAHNVTEALRAQEAGADYLGCGAVFGSSTKNNVTPLKLEELSAICQAVTIPVAAIGGITLDNMERLKGCGMDGVAVISAVFAQKDIRRAVERIREKVERMTEIRIYMNGKEMTWRGGSLQELLEEQGYRAEQVAVERNEEIVPRALFSQTLVNQGDRLEVVSFVGGG